jgi:hypothetical protein
MDAGVVSDYFTDDIAFSDLNCTQFTARVSLEAVMEIAEQLAHSFDFRTLANLNQCCKQLHQETLPVLFKKVVWDKKGCGGSFITDLYLRVGNTPSELFLSN